MCMQVPNGVHIVALASVGGWSEEELRESRYTINSLCVQTLPDMVLKMLHTFAE